MRKITKIILCILFVALSAQTFAAGVSKNHSGQFMFAVLGDNRSGDRVYVKVLKALMRTNPAFVVNTGDLIPHPGDRSEWAHFRETSKIITVPYYFTPGNHDIDDEKSQQVWKDEVDLPGEETYYSWTYGTSLFAVLNSCDPADEKRIAGRQLAWLAHTLDPARYEHQFVFVHHPLFMWQGATHRGDSLDKYPEARDELHRLLVQKKVDIVFEGHEHTYRRMNVDGVEYVVTGGGGAPLYGSYANIPFNHFTLVTVDGPRVAVKVVDRDGALRDDFVLNNRR